jgi:HNH endonuclease
MDKILAKLIRTRAGNACEYCHLPVPPFHIEHIIARQHGGLTVEANLALSCVKCNYHKGPNISGIDPESLQIVRLFHPRNDLWNDHFRWEGPRLVGLSPQGGATIAVLEINHPLRIELRERLIMEGKFLIA